MNNHIIELNIDALFRRNNEFAEHYRINNLLMQLIKSYEMSKKDIRERLLDCIQVFSDYFQKAVMLRYIFCDNTRFLATTIEHLQEEFSHNLSLNIDRNYRAPAWDPILEATAAWFSWKMFTFDQEEKIVLIHLVLETSASIFFHEAHKVMHAYGETSYFKIHSEVDEKHEQMGRDLLTNLSNEKYQRLLEVQAQGWDMLNTICNRIAKLTETNTNIIQTSMTSAIF